MEPVSNLHHPLVNQCLARAQSMPVTTMTITFLIRQAVWDFGGWPEATGWPFSPPTFLFEDVKKPNKRWHFFSCCGQMLDNMKKTRAASHLDKPRFPMLTFFLGGGVGIHIFYGTTSPVSFYSWPQLRSLILGSHQHHVNYGMFLWKPGRKSQISAKTCCFFLVWNNQMFKNSMVTSGAKWKTK